MNATTMNTARKRPEAGRPRAGTLGASSHLSRFTRIRSVNTAIWQSENRDQLDDVKPCTIRHFVRIGKIRGKGRPFRILGSELFKLVS
jgi:hypothetical protein